MFVPFLHILPCFTPFKTDAGLSFYGLYHILPGYATAERENKWFSAEMEVEICKIF